MKHFSIYTVTVLATALLAGTAPAQNVQTKSPTALNTLPAASVEVLRAQNGLIAHRVAGTTGQFGTGDQWIGIGAPLSSLYGERTQWNGQAFIKALRRRNATGDTTKDAILEWGNQGGEMQFRYITNPTVSTGFRRILTLTANGNAYFGSTPPPFVSSTPRLGINADAGGIGINSFAIDGVAGLFNAFSNSFSTATGVLGFAETPNPFSTSYAVRGVVTTLPEGSQNVGVYGELGTNASPTGAGSTNWGVVGLVNKVASDGFQVGVLGEIAPQTADVNSTNYAVAGFATNVGTTYAGYFQGDVFTTAMYLPSDRTLKQNITAEKGVLEQLRQLNPVLYDFNIAAHKGFNLPTKKQHGLIAEEVQALFPELVRTTRYITKDEKGKPNISKDYMAVNYVGLIPILIKAIQEQQTEIETLKAALLQKGNALSTELDKPIITKEGSFKASQFTLEQNRPNPFSSTTTIRYALPQGLRNATLAVFDLNGRMQLQYNNLNGSSQITIDGNTLQPGMYIYSLLAEGQEVISKRMVLTK